VKDDLDNYIEKRKLEDYEFSIGFDTGYENFKIGVILKQLREGAGLTQENIAEKLNSKKSAISRIENHTKDIRFSTLINYAKVLDKKIKIQFI